MLEGRTTREGAAARVAVVGSGISGLSAAWLLSLHHDVTLYEKAGRLGGHAHTMIVDPGDGPVAVDTGFIVFNPLNYPNLTALFGHLGVETAPSDMSFAVSLAGRDVEYGGGSLAALFAQPRNLVRPRFLSMLRDLVRFYRTAPRALAAGLDETLTLGEFLKQHRFREPFIADHLLPMAGAIWSASPSALAAYPAAAFIRFFDNHGLLKFSDRPPWRTVTGGSRRYVEKLAQAYRGKIRLSTGVDSVSRQQGGVLVTSSGETERYDRIVIAAHADEALAILSDPCDTERAALSAFSYTRNRTILHTDARLMPQRQRVWSSWNYLCGADRENGPNLCVTYWMNRLQPLATVHDLFVTLNPLIEPAPSRVLAEMTYEHPVFTRQALAAQRRLRALQGVRDTWFAGAYFGSGFHEDGLRAGLEAAESLGGCVRPWNRGAAPVEARHVEVMGAAA